MLRLLERQRGLRYAYFGIAVIQALAVWLDHGNKTSWSTFTAGIIAGVALTYALFRKD